MVCQSKYNIMGTAIILVKIQFVSVRWNKIPTKETMGDFELLIDEDIIQQEETEINDRNLSKSAYRWK